jgi:regulator of RNase E activity RraA
VAAPPAFAGAGAADRRTRLEALSASAVEDARGKRGAPISAIRRLHGDGVTAGRAMTARCGEGPVSAVLRVLPNGRGEVGVPIRIGAEEVRPGDWLVGDAGGVVVVPAEEIETVVARAEEITEAEAACWASIRRGESFFEQPSQDGTTLGERMLRED